MAALLNRARMEHGEVRASYCCDSPEERREMSMRIVPVENNGMRVEHQVVRTQIYVVCPGCLGRLPGNASAPLLSRLGQPPLRIA